ncbi:cytochrome P450 CYP736A12-like [Cucurbita pepo subsp. pepo]|uniref:cytochrome P450 CYP736A12-like n=1 Tax=Cucurbita pepo subsp. pepo TaxID=3664 RepID=UPI000C9D7092|nr:cytochrome P450 CYP736A12-like [Cucurbita pepo subsp. pepo]
MAWIWIIIIMFALVLLFRPWVLRNKGKNLPPGPKGFPILGSLHLLGKLPHRDIQRLSQRYGPIMHMKLGLVNTIVVSSPEAAALFLKTHDLVYASRPTNEVFKHMSYGERSMVFSKYGHYWRNMRKICTLELLSNQKVNFFKSMRREELSLLIDELREAAKSEVVVNLSSKVCSLSANMTCLMIFGKKFEDRELDERGFKWVVQEALKLAAAFNLGDFIPFISALDLQGLIQRAKCVNKVCDRFFERILDEHLESKNEDSKDFVDVMLGIMGSEVTEYQIDRSSIKAIMLDILLAATDSSAVTIGWAVAELIKHPHVMKKVQDELEKVVGLNRMVEETDLCHLTYLEMVVKEVLRLHPPGPLIVPHEAVKDCTVNNFHIPKKSRIIINVWAIGRNPSAWTDAEKFFPERFIGSQVDVKGKDFQLLPFGSGRRGCPGMQVGLVTVHLILAELVHCFDWKLPNGMLPVDLDMTEAFGLSCPIAQDIMVTPIYRLRD